MLYKNNAKIMKIRRHFSTRLTSFSYMTEAMAVLLERENNANYSHVFKIT